MRLRAVPGAGLAAPRRDRDVEAIVNEPSLAPIFGERKSRAAGPEATDALSEARAVVLILRASQRDWRASAWWLARRRPERWARGLSLARPVRLS